MAPSTSFAARREPSPRAPALSRRAARRLTEARAAAAQASAEAEKARTAEARRADFGAETLAPELRPVDPDRIDQVNSKVAEILSNRAKQPIWLLENGQLWRHIDGDATFNVRVGEDVRIERGAVGSYRMFFLKSRRAVGVRRLR